MADSSQANLSLLVVRVVDTTFEALGAVAARTEAAVQRQELAAALHALRQRLLRVAAVLRWSPRASEAAEWRLACENAALRDAAFVHASQQLAGVHAACCAAAEPLSAVVGAVSALGGGVGAALPACITSMVPLPSTALPRVDAALRGALLKSPRPPGLRVARVAGGRATLRCEGLYEVDVTLSPARDGRGGFALLRLRLLPSPLAPSFEARLLHALNARCAASPSPLVTVHDICHPLAVTTGRERLVRTAKKLPLSVARPAPLPGGAPGVALHYWAGQRCVSVLCDPSSGMSVSHTPPLSSSEEPRGAAAAPNDAAVLLARAQRLAAMSATRACAAAVGADAVVPGGALVRLPRGASALVAVDPDRGRLTVHTATGAGMDRAVAARAQSTARAAQLAAAAGGADAQAALDAAAAAAVATLRCAASEENQKT